MAVIATLEKAYPGAVEPPHEVTRPRLLESLVLDMQLRGWIGRPILAVRYGVGYAALTGTHRITAARRAHLERIPVLVLEATEGEDEILGPVGHPRWGLPTDESLPDALEDIGAPRKAVALAKKEFEEGMDI